ncbi:MAG TPA: zinc-dependent metalloprotease [Chitinophagaceae bacterium]|nr:zinc-dependent metalloprotease [Chitinophagaceae bacterium]
MIQAKRTLLLLASGIIMCMYGFAQNNPAAKADTTKKAPPTPPKPTVAEKVKSSKKIDGLFTLYQDTANGSVQLYVKKNQLGKEYIYQSFSMGGPTSLFLHQNMIRATWVFKIKKNFDKVEFSQVNTNFWYDPNNAVSKAANVDVTEAVFYSAKIDGEDSTGYVLAGDALFLSEKLDPVKPLIAPGPAAQFVFNLGSLNTAKSGYKTVRSYPNNTDVVVELAYDNPAPFNQGRKDITDARYNRIRFQHSFLEMPENDFRPRFDDPRVGYFTQEVENLTTIKVADYKDVINRWDLKKKDPNAAVSEPVEPIVWWIENTTPVEYRQTIKEAGEKWNEAFEKAGFKNAVVMKIMPDDAKWDPADIRYNVIRWVSSPYPPYGAIGPSFVNPKTGQILGADITVEWMSGSSSPIAEELFDVKSINTDLPSLLLNPNKDDVSFPGYKKWMACTLAQELKAQFTTGLTTLEATGASDAEIKELHKQFLYYLIMHEMGHTMGLNHNMKASQMLSLAEINNKEVTHSKGLTGSVMDYPAVNVSLDRNKQGDYYTTKAGPYDIWAIEFGYTPFSASEEWAGLKKILNRSTEPGHTFGNDADDMRAPGGGGIDPRVMINDMSSDMVAYAEQRFDLVNSLVGKLKEKYSKPGRSYAELRARWGTLMGQRNGMAQGVSRYIGGVMVDRSFVGQETTAKPFTPVSTAYQKKAMALLTKYIFAPDAFKSDAALFPYLQLQRRGFNFFGTSEDIKPQTSVLALQVNVFAHLLSANTLTRINNSTLYGNKYTAADMMNDLTNAVFAADLKTNVNLYRLNLQTEYVKGLAAIISAPVSPYDNASKAAMLHTLKKIKGLLATAVSTDEQTRAHRSNLNFIIDKALAVK